MSDRLRFDGQVAIVTGAGRGLGRAYANELADRGCAVVVNDPAVDEAGTGLADVVVECIVGRGGRAVANRDSVATQEGGRAIVATAMEAFSSVDIVINNAGVMRHAMFDDLTLEQLDAVLDTHLKGAFFVTQAAWPHMRGNGYGRIVLTSSASGAFGKESHASYAAAKAGLIGFGKVLGLEGAHHGIKANSVLPMAVTTPRAGDGVPTGGDNVRTFDAWQKLQDRSEPERVAALVLYLASCECAVTGDAFSSLGGRYSRVFVGVTAGWVSPGSDIAAPEDVRDNLDAILDEDGYVVPDSLAHEIELAVAAVAGAPDRG
jgi:NAD(P)-dependent dehydrogenase (short-subunit alcohol dehydrogenase family)